MDPKSLGERLRAARVAAGLSQRDVALQIATMDDRLRLTYDKTVGTWERGEVDSVPFHAVAAIAEVTGKPLSFFSEAAEELEQIRMHLAASLAYLSESGSAEEIAHLREMVALFERQADERMKELEATDREQRDEARDQLREAGASALERLGADDQREEPTGTG